MRQENDPFRAPRAWLKPDISVNTTTHKNKQKTPINNETINNKMRSNCGRPLKQNWRTRQEKDRNLVSQLLTTWKEKKTPRKRPGQRMEPPKTDPAQ